MSLRVFCVLAIVLVVTGVVVAPGSSSETPRKTPAPPKRIDQSQGDYANDILNGKDISEFDPELLPKPDVNIHKYVLTDDASTVEGFLKHGQFVPKFIETWVYKVEDQTAYRLTVQDHYNNFMFCVQRIRIYEELETPEEMTKRLAKNPADGADENIGQQESTLEGKALPRAQSPLQGQSSARNQSPLQGQASPRNQSPLQGQASPINQSPLQGQASPRNQSPLEGKSSVRGPPSGGTTADTKSTRSSPIQRSQNKKNSTPRRKFKETPREDILAKCEGGFEFRPHTRYRFGFADTIFFYGANRIIYKLQDPNLTSGGGYICHERSYTIGGRVDKVMNEQQCKTKIEKIFAWQGTMRNLIWNLFHHPMSLISRRAFQEK